MVATGDSKPPIYAPWDADTESKLLSMWPARESVRIRVEMCSVAGCDWTTIRRHFEYLDKLRNDGDWTNPQRTELAFGFGELAQEVGHSPGECCSELIRIARRGSVEK